MIESYFINRYDIEHTILPGGIIVEIETPTPDWDCDSLPTEEEQAKEWQECEELAAVHVYSVQDELDFYEPPILPGVSREPMLGDIDVCDVLDLP